MTATTRTTPRDRQHARDRDGAVRTLAMAAHARGQEATGMWERHESGLPDPRPLDAIAADLGKVMADTVFAGVEGLSGDHRRFRERFGIGAGK